MNAITYDNLKTMYEKNDVFTLIDVLPKVHYDNVHFKNAINICVYEMSFISSIDELKLKKDSKIVLYGNNHNDVDSKAAYEKLILAKYINIFYIKNPFSLTDKTYLEGKNITLNEEQVLNLPTKRFSLSSNNTLTWTGKNTNGSHTGSIKLSSGFISYEKNVLEGEFIVDMKSIDTSDLTQEQGKDYLNTHLNSEDFFFTHFFPQAKFSFSNISLEKDAYLTANNCILEGVLSIKGISKPFACAANLSFIEERLVLSSTFSFDRTFWNIIYGSSKFFKYLGMHKVFDDIIIDLRLELE